MPEQISVAEFLKETWEDYKSPTTSTFLPCMSECRSTVSFLEEILDHDRSGLTKMKKSTKALLSSGNCHVSNELYLSENLQKLGAGALNRDHETGIGAAFVKFSVVTQELSCLMKNLMKSLNNLLLFPLDNFLKGDLRTIKGEMKKPFEKAWKEYDSKFNKIEKEKKQLAKEAGMIKTDISSAEVAEELEKERRIFQLQMCEYLIKVNEIKTKKSVELLNHLIEYYQAQANYFRDGLKTIDHFKSYVDSLGVDLSSIKARQDVEHAELVELKDALHSSMTSYKECNSIQSAYSLHQLQGNKAYGSEKIGNLLKKSEGRMRKIWQRRRCIAKDGCLLIYHSDTNKDPAKLNLLTCQVKLVHEDPTKKCFDLISSSKNRTYHFQAEDSREMEEWISVLNNAKEAVLMKAFGDSGSLESSPINQSLRELTRQILQEVRRLPGNRICCDCSSPDPEWLSVNLGVLICLECCGVHRDMGVHISRTQSIVIDDLGTSQLLLARVVSNKGFNEIMEATLDPSQKPTASSNMELRKDFIRSKYERRRYAIVTSTNSDDRRQDLKQAILSRDVYALLQVYAEGIDFTEPLPDTEKSQTALHLAIREEEGFSLYMVDFIIQNSNSQSLEKPTSDGDSALHLCAYYGQTECMKLLLRVRPELVHVKNAHGQTAADVAVETENSICLDLLRHAADGKYDLFSHVNIDWELIQDDHLYEIDYSDDDLDGCTTPDRKMRSRPGSLVLNSDSTLQPVNTRERSLTSDAIRAPCLPSPPSGAKKIINRNSMPLATTLKSAPLHQLQHQHSDQGGTGAGGTLTRKKAPAPPPPPPGESAPFTPGHARNVSEGGGLSRTLQLRRHVRSPSDPPPSVVTGKNTPASSMPGAKLVLPPPPEFGPDFDSDSSVRTNPNNGKSNYIRNKGRPYSEALENHDRVMTSNRKSIVTRSNESLDSDGSVTSGTILRTLRTGTGTVFKQTTAAGSATLPVPTPRVKKKPYPKHCRALYDCEAEAADELSFKEGEMIIVLREEEEEWWYGYVRDEPSRKGMFPVTFTKIVAEA